MTDSGYELTCALIAAMKADDDITSYVGSRVYERPPDGTTASPYISMGSIDSTDESYDCVHGSEITINIDVWSWGDEGDSYSRKESMDIAGAIKAMIQKDNIELQDNAIAVIEVTGIRYLRDEDGSTNHAVVTVTATVEEFD